jgi:hypothetical protein
MTDRKPAVVRRRPQLLDDQARTDSPLVDNDEDAWVANFISRLAGTLRNIKTRRRKQK